MPRKRNFDREDVLDKALGLFWQKGYFGASVDDLVKTTGVSRKGLYETLGNKHDVFEQTLHRYILLARKIWAPLQREDASLLEIQEIMKRYVELADAQLLRRGCLFCNTMIEMGAQKDPVVDIVNTYVGELRTLFAGAAENARRKGELPADKDPAKVSALLSGTVLAVCVLSRSGADRSTIQLHVDSALDALCGASCP